MSNLLAAPSFCTTFHLIKNHPIHSIFKEACQQTREQEARIFFFSKCSMSQCILFLLSKTSFLRTGPPVKQKDASLDMSVDPKTGGRCLHLLQISQVLLWIFCTSLFYLSYFVFSTKQRALGRTYQNLQVIFPASFS